MATKTYSGKLQLVGSGTWNSEKGNTASVIELGDHSLKNVRYSDYLKNYLEPGNEMEITVKEGFQKAHPVFSVVSILLVFPLIFTLILYPLVLQYIGFVRSPCVDTIQSITVNGKIYTN